MRIHVDLKSHLSGQPEIIQVERDPEPGANGRTPVNGRYVIPVPLGLEIPVNSDSYVVDNTGDTDGGDVVSQGFSHLLASFPQYGHVYFNPLLTEDHVAELSFSQSFVDPASGNAFTPRFQTGRAAGGADAGLMPCNTALLPANSAVATARPGLVVSTAIDIGPYTLDCDNNEVGTDQFMLYWKLYGFTVSDDVNSETGATAGQNEPAIRYIEEVDQEPAGFSAYLSTDGGATWCEVGLLEPVAFGAKAKSILIAFKNTTANKVYLANFALLF